MPLSGSNKSEGQERVNMIVKIKSHLISEETGQIDMGKPCIAT